MVVTIISAVVVITIAIVVEIVLVVFIQTEGVVVYGINVVVI